MSKQETVEVTVTVELTKEQHDFFEGLAKFVRMSMEDIFKEELETTIRDFEEGGFLDSWVEHAVTKYGANLFKKEDKKIEELSAKELVSRYFKAKAKEPSLSFNDFLERR